MKLRLNSLISAIKNMLNIKSRPELSRTIHEVPTSIAVFIGLATSGVMHKPIKIKNYTAYEKHFGPPHPNYDLATSVRLFFLNGGENCFVVNISDKSVLGSAENIHKLYQDAITSLDSVDTFNLLVITKLQIDKNPMTDPVYLDILAAASEYCTNKRAFLLIDPLNAWDSSENVTDHQEFNITKIRSTVIIENSASYFPRIEVQEFDSTTNTNITKLIGPAAAIAGIMARTDATRGVWKAPAGVEAALAGIKGVDLVLTNSQNDALSKEGINCIRVFESGIVCWGARTLAGSDDLNSEWKYVSVRRFAIFLEHSIHQGTSWVVFEPNEEATWDAIRSAVNIFIMGLFKRGAFQGTTPKEAFFIKCDSSTNIQTAQGSSMRIIVGFAPIKPAEFIILQIQHTKPA